MYVETHNKLGNPRRIECTRVVIRDVQFNNPIAVIIEHTPGQFWIAQAGEEKFQRALDLMGIKDTLIVHSLEESESADGRAS
ncbi:unnamed protein product, partial [marine sediment metagenome]